MKRDLIMMLPSILICVGYIALFLVQRNVTGLIIMGSLLAFLVGVLVISALMNKKCKIVKLKDRRTNGRKSV